MKSFFWAWMLVVGFGMGVFAAVPKIPKAELDAINRLVTLYKLHPKDSKNSFDLAIKFASNGFIEEGWSVLKAISPTYAIEVVTLVEPLQKANPTNWEYPFKLGFAYYFLDHESKDFSRSIMAFKRVLDIKPDHLWSMGFIALLEGMSGRHRSAIRWCQKALKIEPNAMPIHALLALGYQKDGQIMKALGEGLIVGRLKTEYAVSGYQFDL